MRLFNRRLIERYSPSSDLAETLLVVRTLCFVSSCLNRMLKTQLLLVDPSSQSRDLLATALQEIAESFEREAALAAPPIPSVFSSPYPSASASVDLEP